MNAGSAAALARTAIEADLEGIWAELLGAPPRDSDHDFFEAGGSSVMAAALVARACAGLGVELPLSSFVEEPTIGSLARRIEEARTEQVRVAAEPKPAHAVAEAPPCSYAQERFLFIDEASGSNAVSNVSWALRLLGALDANVLEDAFAQLARRHDSLRTRFEVRDGQPVQVVEPAGRIPLDVIEVSGEPEASRLAGEAARVPFDLRRGPLLRARLLRLGDEDHVLQFVAHHIICDDWSKGVIMTELGALYEAIQAGATPELDAPGIQYPEFARRQRERLDEEYLDGEAEHWRRELAGVPPALELPTDRPRPPARSMRGARLRTTVPPELVSTLRERGRDEGATFFMTMLAALEALLHRYTGQEDFVVGAPIDNRGRIELESGIGLFSNVLGLRADLSGRPSFRELLRRTRVRTLDAIAHQDLPFDRLAASASERDPGRHPIFQAFCEFNVPAPVELPIRGVEVGPFDVPKDTSEFDLALYLDEQRGGLDAVWEYSTDLFEAETVERMGRHFIALLGELVGHPDRPVRELALLDEAELAQSVAEWNATDAPLPERCIHDLFEETVRRTPAAAALLADGVTVTYAELNARANRVAHLVRALGAGPADTVGLCLGRSVDLIAGLLGVLKAGAAYVPLNPDHPPGRLTQQLTTASAKALLTESALVGELPGYDGELVFLDAESEQLRSLPDSDPEPTASPDDVAYVMFTSGSTGAPKGVAVRQRSLVNYTAHMLGALAGGPEASGLHFASVSAVSTDLGNTAIFPALAGGGCLHLVDSAVATDAGLFEAYVEAHPIDVLKITPSHLSSLIDAAAGGSILPRRWLVLGGEALTWELADRVTSSEGPRVLNHYGPTEATVGCCTFEVQPDAPRPRSSTVPIGRPISNSRAYVLDGAGAATPVGVAGELHIGGVGVAAGYINRPDLTEEAFLPDPFADDPGARLYRTGDLARRLADGAIEFLGRVDEQVKIRGFRVEPAEVQAVLLREPGVRQAAVIATGEGEAKRLVAYAVSEVSADTLRASMEQALPAYMVPSSVVMVDVLPLTPTGKLDRSALPVVEPPAPPEGDGAPVGELEAQLARIWAEILEHEVGVHDDFFRVGGHSLLGMRLMSRLRAELDVQLGVTALMDAPTIRMLAPKVEAARGSGEEERRVLEADGASPALERAPRHQPLRCSFAQEQFWLVDQLTPGTAAYNFSWPMRLRGRLDVDALERAAIELVRRHEVLRTRFEARDGDPVQAIDEAGSGGLTVVDVSGEPDPEQTAMRLVDGHTRIAFDLSRGPLFRMQLVRLADDYHVLQIVVHHIVFDGVSKVVLYDELSALYEAFVAGRKPPLAELEIQYGDYAEWERERLTEERVNRELAHWRARLEGIPAALELPTDRPRPSAASMRGARHRRPFPRELRKALEGVARAEGATFFMALVAAFDVLLYRYTGQQDVVVGAPIDTRTRPELERVVGPFINTIVLRSDLSGSPSFRDLLGRVRGRTLEALEHQELPFERLVGALAPERDLSRHPIFQVLLAVNPPEKGLDLRGIDIDDIDPTWSAARVDLFLVLDDLPQGLEAIWEFSTDLFDPETVERLAGHFVHLLEEVVRDPDQPIDQLQLLGEAERARVLVDWNRTQAPVPDRRLEELIADQARLAPDRVAVECEGSVLTYADVEARANQLAHSLRERGAGREDLVGICLSRSEELLVALLGTMKAGAAYVPIDPAYPEERQRLMLEDAQVAVMITEVDLLPGLPIGAAQVLCVDGDRAEIAGRSTEPPERVGDPGGLAYVIYTSGSTGRPKGVEIEHRALVNFLSAMRAQPGLDEDDVLVAVTTLSFDISGLELYLPLIAGARLVIAPSETAADPRSLARLLDRSGATVMQATPTTWRMLIDDGWDGRPGFRALCGGEALPSSLADELVDRGLELSNMYGPTETTIWSAVQPLRAKGELPAIGRPIANTTLFVLDPLSQPTPVGVPGELHIGGAGLARGYRNRPDLTAERFIPDPFSATPEGRLYRTGDRARYLADGTIEFLGRLDDQVKLRGFRIELGEIETRLLEHPAVAAAAATIHRQLADEPALVGYIVPAGEAPDGEEVRRFLARSLPGYMVPASIVTLEALPLTPNGKVNRRALTPPDLAAAGQHAHVAPRNELEEVIADLWADVLGIDRVGVEDDFFELGGQSLLAARLIGRLRSRLEADLTLRALFEAPTIAGLAARVEAAKPTEEPPALVPAARVRAPSFAQERFWFIEQVAGDRGAYNISWPLRLGGPLDVPALQRALNEIVRRHEVLRTSLAVEDGRPVQVVAPAAAIELEFTDLRGDPDPERRAREIVDEQTLAPFDISKGPVIRAGLLRLDDEEHLLQVVVHHVAADAWSKSVFFDELGKLYLAFSDNRPSQLPDLAVQYGDFADWQRSWLDGDRLARQLEYWEAELDRAPLLELPTDRPRPPVGSMRGEWLRTSLSADLVDALGTIARDEGATLFMVFLAAFDVLLHRYTGQEDLVVGTPVETRSQAELEQLIGPLVNTLVLRADLSGSPTFRELLGRVRRRTLDALDHQELPFERLVETLAPERDLSRHPIVQALIALYPPEKPIHIPGLEAEELETAKTTSRVDLTLLLQAHEDGFDAVWEYSTDLFEANTIEAFARQFGRLLRAIAADPERPIGELELLDERERTELLTTFAAESAFDDTPVHERFEAQAKRAPDAVAVVCEGVELSYGELNARANRLAHRLRSEGVGAETLVALCLERSIEMVVAIVAVLKAGGAYVPLDPGNPPERLQFVLADCRAPVLLTEERLLQRLPAHAADVISLDRDAAQIGAESPANPERLARSENLAYVIYTSGSTGQPKGVEVEHGNVSRLFSATSDWYHPDERDTWSLVHNYAFDVSVWELWGALAHGGRLVVVPFWTTRSPAALAALLAEERVSVLSATPSLFFSALEELIAAADELSLRLVVFGGEALQPKLLRPWFERFGDRGPELVNMYGITETTVHSTYRPIAAADVEDDASPIGRPIPDLSLYVLDQYGSPVPEGVTGELYVGGAGVARGYLNRPELSAERFIENPFGPGRLYRSGDLARLVPGKGLVFGGRIDDQVKIRGFRVELGEVRAAIADHEAVAEAAVVASETAPGDTRLAAYVVPDPGRAGVVRRLMQLEREGRLAPEQCRDLPNGMVVAHPSQIETNFLYDEIFDRESYLQHGIALPDRACVFDVGANAGLFSLFVGRMAPSARIFAFEPIPPLFELLSLNAELYGLDAVLLDCGLSDTETTAEFTYVPNNSLISGLFVDVEAERAAVRRRIAEDRVNGDDGEAIAEDLLRERLTTESFVRPVRTLSEVIAEQGVTRIDLLKVDVEKAEWDVLAGIAEDDWPKIQQVVAEVHGDAQLKRIVTALEERRFHVESEREDPDTLGGMRGEIKLYARRGELPSAPAAPGPRWESPARLRGDLRGRLRKKLPEHMVPSSFTLLEELPLTRNGKVDRRALPSPDEEQVSGALFEPPVTETEQKLATLWTELLGATRVGLHDDFFELGGHSLVAAQLAARVRECLGAELSVRAVFEQPTLAALAGEIDSGGRAERAGASENGDAPVPSTRIARRPTGERFPLSYSQEQLWLMDQWDPGAPTYNVPLAFRVRGRLDLDALRKALDQLLARHEALRTVIEVEEETPVAVVLDHAGIDLSVLDVTGPTHAEQESEVDRLLRERVVQPFDLERDPLLRASVLRLNQDDHVLLLETHHIAFDGWSEGLLLDELGALYEGRELADPPIQFGDFALWQRGHISAAELGFWRRHLAGAPTSIALPVDHPRPSGGRFQGGMHDIELDRPAVQSVAALCREENVTPYMMMLAALGTLLYRVTGQDDILIGSPVANRASVELESLIGFVSNTLVFRTRLSGNPTFRELVGRVREMALDVYANQEVPFEKVVEAVSPDREPGVNPLFQVNLRVSGSSRGRLRLAGLETTWLRVDSGLARFDLALDIELLEAGIRGYVRYNRDIFEPATIARLADEFTRVLSSVLDDADRRLLSLELSGGWDGSSDAAPAPAGAGPRGYRRRGPNQ